MTMAQRKEPFYRNGQIRRRLQKRLWNQRIWQCCFLIFFILLTGIIFLEKKTALVDGVQLFGNMRDCTKSEIRLLVKEIKKFPVKQQREMFFENGYGGERTYGGQRKHEGIDILPKKPGDYDVVSATDGVVESLGWLELGGYRIGIRSSRGFYYYYAHLEKYQKGLKKGSRVKAGDILGKMGNTGYGKEGTKGKFVVHLHFGIYRQRKGKEKSLNPYYLLRRF